MSGQAAKERVKMKSEKKLLPALSFILVSLLVLTCRVFAPETSAPDEPAPAPTSKPEPTDEDAILVVTLKEDPLEFGDVDQIDNGYVRAWLWFPGTLENVGTATLTDLRICIYLEYEIAYKIAGDCSDLPDLAVGETAEYGVGFHAEAPPDAIASASYKITVRSGDSTVNIVRAK